MWVPIIVVLVTGCAALPQPAATPTLFLLPTWPPTPIRASAEPTLPGESPIPPVTDTPAPTATPTVTSTQTTIPTETPTPTITISPTPTYGLAAARRPWDRHTIDDTSIGADGTRMGDVNGDGRLDIVTGWEEGGIVRVYLQPEGDAVRHQWPFIEVHDAAARVEDAFFADLDADGVLDVIVSTEDKDSGLSICWGPTDVAQISKSRAWDVTSVRDSNLRISWMFADAVQIDGKNGLDLIAGGKLANAQVGWFAAPPDPHRTGQWVWHPIAAADWVMSLIPQDMDADGDQDILVSNRSTTGPEVVSGHIHAGTSWLENPGTGPAQAELWPIHQITTGLYEVEFAALADVDGDGLDDVLTTANSQHLIMISWRRSAAATSWDNMQIPAPASVGDPKSLAVGDIDLDGRQDIVLATVPGAQGTSLDGIVWASHSGSPREATSWNFYQLSGIDGLKYDLVVLYDVDQDGDLDLITSEEIGQLGVIWYENPLR
jgi:hypothetical protein